MKITKVLTIASLLAASTSSQAFTWYEQSFFQDQDLERLINSDGSDINTNSTLDVGDRLSGVLSFDTISNYNNTLSQNFTAMNEDFTGIFDVEVISKTGSLATGFTYEFGATATFEATYGAGAAIAFFNQTPGNLNVQTCSSVADCESKATDGVPNPYLVLGFTGDADEQWASRSDTDDLAVVKATQAQTALGNFYMALGIITNNTGKTFLETAIDPTVCSLGRLDCAGDGKVLGATGSGNIKGGAGLVNGYDARSNFDMTMTTVPEPASIALLGMGLLGFGFSRKKSK